MKIGQHNPVRDALAAHFIMWRNLDGPLSGEWFCECGKTFGFSDTAIDHVADEIGNLR